MVAKTIPCIHQTVSFSSLVFVYLAKMYFPLSVNLDWVTWLVLANWMGDKVIYHIWSKSVKSKYTFSTFFSFPQSVNRRYHSDLKSQSEDGDVLAWKKFRSLNNYFKDSKPAACSRQSFQQDIIFIVLSCWDFGVVCHSC